ncbi:hypothetical protein JTE90_009997 [Oedothorax gibbosus]|uniref:CCHC-type domain-containing protein n=1 Tax=Oedothorax gibbosus TaxID=931172 RepID=A0AAV6TF87_9ARAC|nr:hypothetical protein JTE90_009997 [Oedothorax gibbosus]
MLLRSLLSRPLVHLLMPQTTVPLVPATLGALGIRVEAHLLHPHFMMNCLHPGPHIPVLHHQQPALLSFKPEEGFLWRRCRDPWPPSPLGPPPPPVHSARQRVIVFGLSELSSASSICDALLGLPSCPPGPLDVVRFFYGRDGSRNCILSADSLICDFLDGFPRISIDHLRVRVRRFIFIGRCFNCHHLDHLAKDCSLPPACGICGGTHRSSGCCDPPRCLLCPSNNAHRSDSPTCPTLLAYKKSKLAAHVRSTSLRQGPPSPPVRRPVSPSAPAAGPVDPLPLTPGVPDQPIDLSSRSAPTGPDPPRPLLSSPNRAPLGSGFSSPGPRPPGHTRADFPMAPASTSMVTLPAPPPASQERLPFMYYSDGSSCRSSQDDDADPSCSDEDVYDQYDLAPW